MSGNSKAVPFHGILAMGSTRDEAVNRYRLLASGKGASAMVDQGRTAAFVTHASNKIAEMFNPISGELDLSNDASILDNLNFEAQAGEIDVNHYVCESGCGMHLVYDSEQLVKHCPACTTAIASDDDEEEESEEDEEDETDLEDEDEEELDDDLEDEDDTSESGDDEDEESEEDDEESDEDEESEEDDEESDEDEESGDDEDEESEEDDEELEEEDDEDEEEEEDDSSEPLVIASDSKERAIQIYQENRQGIATAATTVEVEYMVCSSSECNAHVITEDHSLTQCPACTSDLKQPEADVAQTAVVAGDDEEDDDLKVIEDDEDDEDEDSEEEEDEDTSESNTNEGNAMSDTAEKISVDMLSQVTDTEDSNGLDLSFSSSISGQPMWTAYLNGTPVATASKVTAGKNADIFEDVSFGNAVIASAKHVGVKVTLNEMGFKGIAHEISVSSIVNERVGTQVAEAKAGLDRDRAEHAERLMSALATAAIGINRGFFIDVKNPMKEALWNALSSAGVKNPEILIDNAFRASSDDYHKSLFVKAGEILANPLDVQESLSKAVIGTNYMAVAATAPVANLESRLANFGEVTASAEKPATQAPAEKQESQSSGTERITSVVAGLGRRRH